MLTSQLPHTFNDFYNSMQSINDSFEPTEGFGREIRQQQQQRNQPTIAKNMKKILSVDNFNYNHRFESNIRKSGSTSTFNENDIETHQYGKFLNYVYEEQSTMASLSPFTSMGSMSSLVSVNSTCHGHQNKSKSKFPSNKKKTNEPDYKVKYKTEVCKYWAQHGFCEFGDQCAFAHGKAEIRQKQHISSNYKTKKCVQFHENGHCPYGQRCQFIHCAEKEPHLNTSFISGSYAQELEFADIWSVEGTDCVCMRRKNRPRLPCLVKIADE